MQTNSTRRDFMKTSAAIGAAVWVGGEIKADDKSPNSRVRYACIGVGGKGASDSDDAARHGDIVAIADIDTKTLGKKNEKGGFENAKAYQDYRVMLDELGDSIDAVTVSTPDHSHAPAAARAISMGKHAFVQKPLTHTVWEARRLAAMTKEFGVKTQMGNQGTSTDGLRRAAAILKGGHLGKIKEVHVFTNRPIWPQGGPRPEPAKSTPENIDWDLWLGPAPERPYANGYHAFAWRGWWDFGTGALGDMACHTFNMPFAGVGLKNPTSIQAECSGHNKDSYPQKSKIRFEFPADGDRPAIPVLWYDGSNKPDESIIKGNKFRHASGSVTVCENGILYSFADYGDQWVIFDNDGTEIEAPKVEFEKSPGHFTEFHQAILGEREQAMSNFAEYAGPLTETILLGNLAVWAAAEGEGKKIEWSAEKLEATNAPEVMNIVKKEYRGKYGEFLKA